MSKQQAANTSKANAVSTTQPHNYADCWHRYSSNNILLKRNTYLCMLHEGDEETLSGFAVALHGSPIVKHYEDKTVINLCGWETPTTLARINVFTDAHINVFKQDGITYLQGCCVASSDGSLAYTNILYALKDDEEYTIYPDGRVTGSFKFTKSTDNSEVIREHYT